MSGFPMLFMLHGNLLKAFTHPKPPNRLKPLTILINVCLPEWMVILLLMMNFQPISWVTTCKQIKMHPLQCTILSTLKSFLYVSEETGTLTQETTHQWYQAASVGATHQQFQHTFDMTGFYVLCNPCRLQLWIVALPLLQLWCRGVPLSEANLHSNVPYPTNPDNWLKRSRYLEPQQRIMELCKMAKPDIEVKLKQTLCCWSYGVKGLNNYPCALALKWICLLK